MRKVHLKIKEAMKSRGLTQVQLSEKANIRQSAISALARGNREMISLVHLEKIANALEIDDINELLTINNEG